MSLGGTSSNGPAGLRDGDGVRTGAQSTKEGAGLDKLRPRPRT